MVTKLGFMVGYTTFLLVFTQFMAMFGSDMLQINPNDVVSGYPTPSFDPESPTSLITAGTRFFTNIAFFFELMSVNSTFWWIGTFVLTPFVIGVTWSLIEIIKDIIPFT